MGLRVRTRGRDERGAAVIEMAFALPVLALFVFGAISFGIVLGFRHTATEASNEGARAGLVDYTANGDKTQARLAARTQGEVSMSSWKRTCDAADADGDGLGCWAYTHDCTYQITGVLDPAIPEATYDTAATPDCLTLVVRLDHANKPLLPAMPLVQFALPSRVQSVSTVQLSRT